MVAGTVKLIEEHLMPEKRLMALVVQCALTFGWEKPYHTHDSRRSPEGFPDLVTVHLRQRRVLYAELKSADGRLTDKQAKWLRDLWAVGAEAYLWRPADWLDGTIERVLRGRP